MKRFILISIFFYFLSQSAHSAQFNDREYKIKAAFIANFIHYTHWQYLPKKSFRFCNTEQRINDVFYQTLADEDWFDLQPLFTLVSLDGALECDILFVDKISTKKWLAFLALNKSTNILIVSEVRGSTQLFSHINFFFEIIPCFFFDLS